MNPALINLPWLPPHAVNRHQRAKYVKLRYSPTTGLQVTVPLRFSMKHLPDVLETHKDWILVQCSKYPMQALCLPNDIHSPLMNRTWALRYEPKLDRPRLRELKTGEIIINTDHTRPEEGLLLIKKWIRRQALKVLPDLFQAVSEVTQLSYRSLSIRSQQSVWGSCSKDQSIRLNDKLIFFPPELAKHIMIHELCHTKIMNHSRAFWALVAKHDSNYEAHRKQCRVLQLPRWLS
ncbi:MAG TPA: SprT family zinc-dependent metalloprotease [Gammaproteobacteria bacterium]|nr:SprT family zinc-dependent metalloprotease [Gammaproteobacteria bacterium]